MPKKKKKKSQFSLRPSSDTPETIEARYAWLDAYADLHRGSSGLTASQRIEKLKVARARLDESYANQHLPKEERKHTHWLYRPTRSEAGMAFCMAGFVEEKPLTTDVWAAVTCKTCRSRKKVVDAERAKAARREAKRMAKQRAEREARLAAERERQRKKDRRKSRKKLRKRKARTS